MPNPRSSSSAVHPSPGAMSKSVSSIRDGAARRVSVMMGETPHEPGKRRSLVGDEWRSTRSDRYSTGSFSFKQQKRPVPAWLQRYRRVAKSVNEYLDEPGSSRAAQAQFAMMTLLILGSSFTLCLGTMEKFKSSDAIDYIEVACGIIFTVELVVRVASWQGSVWKLLGDVSIWVDVLAVLPLYLGMISSSLMLLRLLRLLRLLKMAKHYEGAPVLYVALKRSLDALLIPLFFLFLLTFSFAGAIYYTEGVLVCRLGARPLACQITQPPNASATHLSARPMPHSTSRPTLITSSRRRGSCW